MHGTEAALVEEVLHAVGQQADGGGPARGRAAPMPRGGGDDDVVAILEQGVTSSHAADDIVTP